MMQNALAMALILALAGCGSIELFGRYEVPESADMAETTWPRLVDVPEPPPVGSFDQDVPDPATGVAAVTDLSAAASQGAARAQRLNQPVLSDSQRRRLNRAR